MTYFLDVRIEMRSWPPIVSIAIVLASCGEGGVHGTPADAADLTWADTWDPCASFTDTDGDTIADAIEGTDDFDGDTIPCYLDDDSDGDSIPDSVEAGDGDLCTMPVNSDWGYDSAGNPTGDDWPDFLDTDSDQDGLADSEEGTGCPDYRVRDSDHDGFSDLVEAAAGSDPCDTHDRPPAGMLVIELPFDGPDHVIAYPVFVFEGETVMEVQAVAADEPDDPPEWDCDATAFVKDLRPASGDPGVSIGYSSFDEERFYGVVPGTELMFRVDAYNDVFEGLEYTLVVRAWLDIIGGEDVELGRIPVLFLVPYDRRHWL
jgi:hypothetical protein